MVSTSIRRNLLASTIIAGALATSVPAFAQTAVPAEAAGAGTADDTSDSDTIVVTGSLISNPNLAQSSPVNVTTAEEIQLRQSNVAEEVLRDIPGIVPSIGSAVNNGNGGASFVDLRGLGSNRNIVLLDGYRIAPSGLVGRVDLNNIPLALIERVDALTGGASTTYGADAISGVVNFITRKDFAGAEISVGEQITEQGDGNYARVDVTLGANFDDGRGNATFSIGYQNSDPVYQGDRAFSASNISSFTGGASGSGTSVPSRFTRAGAATQQIDPTTGTLVPTFALFNFNPYNIFQTPFNRYNMYGAAHYQITDGIEVYTRGLFSKNTVSTIIAPSGVFGSAVTIPFSNPFLPVAARNQFCASIDTDPVTAGIQGLTAAQCAAAAAATSPTDPNFRTFTTTLSRRTPEVGPRISDFRTTIFDYRAGIRGDITDNIHFDVSGGYGESENIQTLQGYVLTSRVRAAVFATNTTTCLPNAPGGGASITSGTGCVPLNVFGPLGSITPNQVPFITGESTTATRTSLAQGRAIINGDFGFSSPWASDGVNFAVGGEYRQYQARVRSDTLAQTAGELGGAGGAAPNITGGYDVYEAIGELVVPLVQDKPFFDDLTVKGGIRYSHYTVNAPTTPHYNTTTYKGEVAWSPVRDVKFRGGYSHSVRAPNINELFSPQNTVLTTLSNDPCASLTTAGGAIPGRANPTGTLRAVCLAQGATAGNINLIQNPTANQANVTTGGNLNVKPERSNSYTAGVVLTPSFVPGLSVTADYYHIKVNGAVTTPSSASSLASCFGAPTGGNFSPAAGAETTTACTQIRRNPVTGGLDGDPSTTRGLFAALSNLGQLETDGIDVAISYRRDLGFAKFSLAATGNYTFNSKFNANVTDPAEINRECTGYYSSSCASIQPKFQWSVRPTLGFDDVDVSVLWRHIDSVQQEPDDILNGNGPAFVGTSTGLGGQMVDFQHIKSYDYFDFTVRFGITSNLDLTMSAQNVFDKKPPVVGTGVGTTSFNSGNTYPSTYDALGRRYAVGAKLKF